MIAETMLDIVRRAERGEQLTNSDRILSQHCEFVWQAMFGRHPQSVLLANGLDVGDNPAEFQGDGAPLTMLLQRARFENEQRDQREQQPKSAPPPRIESKPDFIVDSTGTVIDATPAPSVESAPPTPEVSADRRTPAAPPFQVESDPPSAPAPKPKAKQAKQAAHPGANIPGFSDHLARKEHAERVEEIRKSGGRVTAQDLFPPDPVATSVQGPLEVVNFTRVPGGKGIRRVG